MTRRHGGVDEIPAFAGMRASTESRAEIEATRQLAEAELPLAIWLHDHLVFAGGECRSFRELGLL